YLRSELDNLRNIATQVLAGVMEAGTARSALNEMTLRQNDWTLNAYCARYCTTVTQHHTIEDRSVLPPLPRSGAALAPGLDRLAKEPGGLHPPISDIGRAMVQVVAGPVTGGPSPEGALGRVTDGLLSHLADEGEGLLAGIPRHGLAPGQL